MVLARETSFYLIDLFVRLLAPGYSQLDSTTGGEVLAPLIQYCDEFKSIILATGGHAGLTVIIQVGACATLFKAEVEHTSGFEAAGPSSSSTAAVAVSATAVQQARQTLQGQQIEDSLLKKKHGHVYEAARAG